MLSLFASTVPFFAFAAIFVRNEGPAWAALLLAPLLAVALNRFLSRIAWLPSTALCAAAAGALAAPPGKPVEPVIFEGAFVRGTATVGATRVHHGLPEAEPLRLWTLHDVQLRGFEHHLQTVHTRFRNDGGLESGDRVDFFGWLEHRRQWRLDARIEQRRPPSWLRPNTWGAAWRRCIRNRLSERHVGRSLRFLEALLLGHRSFQDDEADAIRHSGASHLFAISGLHLVLLGGMVDRALILLRFRQRPRTLVVAAATTGFALLTGFGPPISRALAFLLLYSTGRLLRRPVGASWCLVLVAAWATVLEPEILTSPSFQLSFAALGGMLWLGPVPARRQDLSPLDAFLRRKGCIGRHDDLRHALQLTGAAMTATAPLTLLHFGSIAPGSIVTSLALLPGVAALLACGLLDIAGLVSPIITSILVQLTAAAMNGAARIPGSFVSTGPPPPWVWPGWILLTGLGLRVRLMGRSPLPWCACAAILLVAAAWLHEVEPRLIVHANGQIVIRSRETGNEIRLGNSALAQTAPATLSEGKVDLDILTEENRIAAAYGHWHDRSILLCSFRDDEATLRFCRRMNRHYDIVVLPAGGRSSTATAALLRAASPSVVVCSPHSEDSILLARQRGCRVVDGREFGELMAGE